MLMEGREGVNAIESFTSLDLKGVYGKRFVGRLRVKF